MVTMWLGRKCLMFADMYKNVVMVVWNIVKRISNSAAERVGSFYIFLDYCVMWT